MTGDRWGDITRTIAASVLEDPARHEAVTIDDLAPGPARDLVAIIRRRIEAGLAAGGASLVGLPEVDALGPAFLGDLAARGGDLTGFRGLLREARGLAVRDRITRAVEVGAGVDELAGIVAAAVEEPVADSPVAYVDWAAFWDRDRSEADWLLDDVLARGRGHSIYAAHKVGKSLLMLWASVELVRAGHVVLYLDFEMGEDDLQERLTDMGCGPDTDLSRLLYALLPSLPPLDRPEGAAVLLRMVDAAIDAHPDRHVVVVVDTIGRAVVGDENSADTIRDFYRGAGLGLKQRGVTWARLDHAGWDATRGARGSSSKGDDVDIVWRLAPADGGGLDLYRQAARMGWVPEKVSLGLQTDPVLSFAPSRGTGRRGRWRRPPSSTTWRCRSTHPRGPRRRRSARAGVGVVRGSSGRRSSTAVRRGTHPRTHPPTKTAGRTRDAVPKNPITKRRTHPGRTGTHPPPGKRDAARVP